MPRYLGHLGTGVKGSLGELDGVGLDESLLDHAAALGLVLANVGKVLEVKSKSLALGFGGRRALGGQHSGMKR